VARRVFFSFHYDRDIWRANQVRNCNVISGYDTAGFFDHSEYEEAKKSGTDGIRRMIQRQLQYTTVTVVLIGSETAFRPWVKYELEQSIARKNGLLGIQIHHLQNHARQTSFRGFAPTVPFGVELPLYDWDNDLARFKLQIEAAGKRSDKLRAVRAAY
jgi:hypothetical protein